MAAPIAFTVTRSAIAYGLSTGVGVYYLMAHADGVKEYSRELAQFTLHFWTRPKKGEYGYRDYGAGTNGGNINNSNGDSQHMPAYLQPFADKLDQLSSEVSSIKRNQLFANGSPISLSTGVIIVGTCGAVLYISGVRSLADLMYVTKKHFNDTVAKLQNGVKLLAGAIKQVRKELGEKIDVVEKKIDDTRFSLEGILDSVKVDVKKVSDGQTEMHKLIRSLENQMNGIESTIGDAKLQLQQANTGIFILCNVVKQSGVMNDELAEFTNKYASKSSIFSAGDKVAAQSLNDADDITGTSNLIRQGLQQLLSGTSSSAAGSSVVKNVPPSKIVSSNVPTALAIDEKLNNLVNQL